MAIESPQANLSSVSPYDSLSSNPFNGRYGSDFLNVPLKDLVLNSGYCKIYATQDSVLNTVVGNMSSNIGPTDTALTLKQGTHIEGFFTHLNLSSGSVVCYLAKERNST